MLPSLWTKSVTRSSPASRLLVKELASIQCEQVPFYFLPRRKIMNHGEI